MKQQRRFIELKNSARTPARLESNAWFCKTAIAANVEPELAKK
ncbi:MAG: hypothetical protein RMX35_04540 [Nostoc sp. DcaGUA01]|nr:hypothetical protein [Nostoc sp. DcaGUA01]